MAVSRIDHNRVNFRAHQFGHAFQIITSSADRGAYPQPALAVFCGEGVFDLLRDVLDCDQSLEILVFIDNQQFLDPVFVQQPLSFLQCSAHRNSDEIFFRHDFADRQMKPRFEAKIAIRQNADQPAVFRDRNARYFVMSHQLDGIFNFVVWRHRDGIDDHAAFRSLDFVDLRRLLIDRHVLVNDSNSALLGKRDCQPGFGYGIHCSADNWNIQFDAPGEPCIRPSFGGKDVGFERNNQNVVKSISVA